MLHVSILLLYICSVNFMKNERQIEDSDVYRMVHGLDNPPKTPPVVAVGSPRIQGVGSPLVQSVGSPLIQTVGSPRIQTVGSPRIQGIGPPRVQGVGSPLMSGSGSPRIQTSTAYTAPLTPSEMIGTPEIPIQGASFRILEKFLNSSDGKSGSSKYLILLLGDRGHRGDTGS